MDKYIDIEDVCNEISRFDGYLDEDMLWRLNFAIRRLPAADVHPTVRANWISHNNPMFSPFDDTEPHTYQCTACFSFRPHREKFCPECGAKMEV